MMINDPIIEIDVHGLKVEEAIKVVQKKMEQAGNGTYRVRINHGYRGDIRIRTAIREEFSYGREPKVKRIIRQLYILKGWKNEV